MTIDPSSAAAAYAKVAQSGVAGGQAPAATGTELNFGEMVQEAIGQVVETGRASEQKMNESVNGDAALIDVVAAVTAAEVTLETVTAVRDRMISAYQEIVRMPI